MRGFWRQVLSIGLAFGALALADTARAQVQHINFDDLGGTGVRPVAPSRYTNQGVLLTGGVGLFVFGPSSFADTQPDWLYASQTPAGGNADAAITMRFRSPADGLSAVTDDVSFSIADGDHLGPWMVQAYDIAGAQRWHQHLLEVGQEGGAIHGAVEHHRRSHAGLPERTNKCRRLPVAVRNAGNAARAAARAAVEPRHLGRCAGFVDEDKAGRIEVRLRGAPDLPCACHVRSLLLAGVRGFF